MDVVGGADGGWGIVRVVGKGGVVGGVSGGVACIFRLRPSSLWLDFWGSSVRLKKVTMFLCRLVFEK